MASTDQTFRASCKLMLFGEYLVLKGSKSLAFPLKFGQKLEVKAFNHPKWTGISPSGIWFTAQFDKDLNVTITSNENSAKILRDLFLKIKEINPAINLNQEFKTTADFKLEWGLGSSSTLLSLLSQWSNVDPYLLLESSFGGSGYDVACASAKSPILYEIESRKVEEVQIPIEISSKLLFVYLDKKQSSLKEITRFKKSEVTKEDIEKINQIIGDSMIAKNIDDFEYCLNESENLLSPIIGRPKLKETIFADYAYSIKSLGAWGGDFFLATYRNLDEAKQYFLNKKFTTMFTYQELIK